MEKPAILGGKPAFNKMFPIINPQLDSFISEGLWDKTKEILRSGMLTNSENVKKLENEIRKYIDVKNVVGLGSCTSGLILSLQNLGIRNKKVIIPSFTFNATANAAYWNNCEIIFADCDRETFTLSIEDVKSKMSKDVSAIIGVHIYGNPCYIKELQDLANEYNASLIFDSAHAFGSKYDGKNIGNFGDCEVFSCSPTKLFITVEGGIVATNNDELAENLRVDRNYGNYPDYTSKRAGLNARMTELNALIGLESLKRIDEAVNNRNKYVQIYKKNLGKIPGISFQRVTENSTHAYKDFGILIDKDEFGVSRDVLYEAMLKENIMCKKYFYPPVHKLEAYSRYSDDNLPNTDHISGSVLCLPIHNYMEQENINDMCFAIERIYGFRKEIMRK